MKEGTLVRLTKLECNANGHANALPVAYTLDGYLLRDITLGMPIKAWRVARNGLQIPGMFTSSPVKDIDDDKILTQNSVWRIEELPDESGRYLRDHDFDKHRDSSY